MFVVFVYKLLVAIVIYRNDPIINKSVRPVPQNP